MADLSIEFCGVRSPNPFWLASAPPTNTGDQVMRAFDAGWGGAVWKTLGNPIVNVTSRFGGIDYGNTRLMGLNNIELITDRPLEVNLREMREVKRRYPKNTLIASLMVETKEEWKEIIQRAFMWSAFFMMSKYASLYNRGCPFSSLSPRPRVNGPVSCPLITRTRSATSGNRSRKR